MQSALNVQIIVQSILKFDCLLSFRANVTFKCMSLKTDENGWTDHSSCCKQRGVSSVCLPLCQGSVKRIG